MWHFHRRGTPSVKACRLCQLPQGGSLYVADRKLYKSSPLGGAGEHSEPERVLSWPSAPFFQTASPSPSPSVTPRSPFCRLWRHLPPAGGSLSKGEALAKRQSFRHLPTAPLGGAVAQRLRGHQSAEPEKTVKRSSRQTGVNLQFFSGGAHCFGFVKGEEPLTCCGVGGVQRKGGGSRNTPPYLWPSGASQPGGRQQRPHIARGSGC